MQILLYLIEEELPQLVLRFLNTLPLRLITHTVLHHLLAVLVEESRYHADCQHVVDELKETLLNDMCVSEEEDRLCVREFLVELLKVLAEFFFFIPPSEYNREDIIISRKCTETSETLLTRPTEPNE
jgi:hypothetical protein